MKNNHMFKTLVFILGLIPAITGILTMLGIYDPIYLDTSLPAVPILDSNLRFFGGIWFVLGVFVLWTAKKSDLMFETYSVLWTMIFVGGIGRLLSFLFVGLPPVPFIGFTILEIVGMPILLYWHYKIRK